MSTRRALLSAAASVVPLPFTDIAADVALLKRTIPKINAKFGLSKEQIDEYDPQTAVVIYDISKRFGRSMIGKFLTEEMAFTALRKMGVHLTAKAAAKYVPLLGQALSATVSFTAMQLIIRSHIRNCYTVARTMVEGRDSTDFRQSSRKKQRLPDTAG